MTPFAREIDGVVVHTKNQKYEPEQVVKHESHVVLIWPDRKKSIPWQRVQEVNEPL
jgi:hypothetical protein